MFWSFERRITIIVLTGESGSGKTRLCQQVIEWLKTQGLDVAGVLTLPLCENGDKVGMDVQSIRTGERQALAARGCATTGFTTDQWFFQDDAIKWGSEILRNAIPCDVLVIDELGPLELERGEGWCIAFDVLRERRYRSAIVVVRPGLLSRFQKHGEGMELHLLSVTRSDQDALMDQIVKQLGTIR